MIATLLRHEWMRTRGLLGTIVGAAPLLAGVGTALTATGWPLISTLGLVLATLVIVGLVPVLQVALAVHYWQSSYSRTGYFTQSLPVRGSTIYTAKLLWAFLVTLVGIVVMFALSLGLWPVAAAQIGAEQNPFAVIGELWSSLSAVSSAPWMAGAVAAVLAAFLIWPVQYFFAASVGSETPLNRHGLGGPVLVFLGLYMATQVAVFAGVFALPWGVGIADGRLAVVPFHMLDEMTVTVGVNVSEVMPIGFIPALLLVTLVCLLRTVYSWNKKVSLV